MRPYRILLSIAVILVFTSNLYAVVPANVWFNGSEQGPILGSSKKIGRQGSSDVFGFDQNFSTEADPKEGCLTGPRNHFPFTITKKVDKASPLLLRAWNSRERLTVTLRLYKIEIHGAETNHYTITLRDAYIAGIREEMPLSFVGENSNYGNMEHISFTYGRYSEKSETTSVTSTDEWFSTCPQSVLSDLNFDGEVNFEDLAIMANQWLIQSF